MVEHQKQSKFINIVDKDMHDNIIRLDQKLKGLQTEIAVKIDSIPDESDESIERKKQLIILSEEVNKALDTIKGLVNIVVSEELDSNEFLQKNHESLEALREIFKNNVDNISKLKEQF